MNTKYVITRVNGRLISAEYSNDKCVSLSMLDESGIMGNIYVGRVENVVKNIHCAFIEIQKGVKCYYPLDDNSRHIFLNRKNNKAVNIGDLMLVQVSREALKTKPATVTSKLSLTGEYVVLSADVTGVTISGKTKKNEHCKELRDLLLAHMKHPDNISDYPYGFILRTNSSNASADAVIAEAEELIRRYLDIRKRAQYAVAFTKIDQGEPAYLKDLRSIPMNDLLEIVTDVPEIAEQICKNLIESQATKLRIYEDKLLPLYKLYSLETELERALGKRVWLKSGGYLIIEQTEALSVIDVNTGKMVTKKNTPEAKEQSFVKTNMEAAAEIARQVRLRNLSGIIIVDFINMTVEDNNCELLIYLRRLFKNDPVTTTVVDITRLGLVEITRKKFGKTLSEEWKYSSGNGNEENDAD